MKRPSPFSLLLLLLVPWLAGSAGIAATNGFLEVDGSRLYYEMRGSGPTMIFLHDGHMHGESWDAQWDSFAQAHRVIRYDRRGYGRSSPAVAPYTNVDDLHRLLTQLSVSNAVLVGCSAGGQLAVDFTLAHPQFVRRLVLAGPVVSGLDFSRHFDLRVDEGFRPLRERNDIGATITNWMNDPGLIASQNTAAKERFHQLLEANPHNWTQTGRFSRSSPSAVARLQEIRVPTLILVGESDVPDVHAHCGALQAGIPLAQRIVISNAAHYVQMEQPAEFNRLVTRFLASSGRPRDLVHYVPAMELAEVRSNLVYKTTSVSQLEADLYLPPNTDENVRLPAVVFVLGDASPETMQHAKDWTFMQSYGRLATTRGLAGITFNHRSSENHTRLPDVRADVDDLLRFVRTNAARLNIDSNRVCLWYLSGSGVHLESGFGTNSAFVRCIVAYYPVLAPSRRAALPDELRRVFSATEQLKRHTPRVPPLLIARAGRDSASLNEHIATFAAEARRAGISLSLLDHPQGEHAFDIRNDDDTSRSVLIRTLKFVSEHLER